VLIVTAPDALDAVAPLFKLIAPPAVVVTAMVDALADKAPPSALVAEAPAFRSTEPPCAPGAAENNSEPAFAADAPVDRLMSPEALVAEAPDSILMTPDSS
jgi:hypothetical protein